LLPSKEGAAGVGQPFNFADRQLLLADSKALFVLVLIGKRQSEIG
jgi:hypothetical protein